VLWRDRRIIDLGTLGDGGSGAMDINDRGEIAGFSALRTGLHAVVWRGLRIIDLGTLPGDTLSFASAINDHGEVVSFSASDVSR
jgi:probable HAF family extracellular repeat protein